MRMANINQSIKRQSAIYTQLRDACMIRFSRKIDNLSVQVLFVDNSDTAIHITDFRSLGYQYEMYKGGAYFKCANCGVTVKKNVKIDDGSGIWTRYYILPSNITARAVLYGRTATLSPALSTGRYR